MCTFYVNRITGLTGHGVALLFDIIHSVLVLDYYQELQVLFSFFLCLFVHEAYYLAIWKFGSCATYIFQMPTYPYSRAPVSQFLLSMGLGILLAVVTQPFLSCFSNRVQLPLLLL